MQLVVLGSTGSIGESTLRVVREHPDRLRVAGLAASGSRPEELLAQVREFEPAAVAVADREVAAALAPALPEQVELLSGPGAATELAGRPTDRVVAAIVGAAGLAPVHAALAAGNDVALANKEALVVAGSLLLRLAVANGATILPVDSEHAALHQALRGGRSTEVRRLVLTASGGPFRSRQGSLDSVTPEEAMSHPTWEMGAKISVDSATLMNKGLELIEATHLFAVREESIEVVVHPQSILHSLVEFCDGSWLAQLSVNDMVFPLQYALAYPERWSNEFPRLDLASLGQLDLEPVDHHRFPSIQLARRALRLGDRGPAVFNAANEVAVAAFLGGTVGFSKIFRLVEQALEALAASETRDHPIVSLEEALEVDDWARRKTRELLAAE